MSVYHTDARVQFYFLSIFTKKKTASLLFFGNLLLIYFFLTAVNNELLCTATGAPGIAQLFCAGAGAGVVPNMLVVAPNIDGVVEDELVVLPNEGCANPRADVPVPAGLENIEPDASPAAGIVLENRLLVVVAGAAAPAENMEVVGAENMDVVVAAGATAGATAGTGATAENNEVVAAEAPAENPTLGATHPVFVGSGDIVAVALSFLISSVSSALVCIKPRIASSLCCL
jgi:hypothetical protein